MKEVKSPKKPLLYYYGITLLVILLFNLLVAPLIARNQVTETDYGTFMQMIEDKDIGKVQVEERPDHFHRQVGRHRLHHRRHGRPHPDPASL